MENFIKTVAPNIWAYRTRFIQSLIDTWSLFLIPGIISFILGLFFGVVLTITKKDGIKQNIVIFRIIDIFINVFRAIPFVILLIFIADLLLQCVIIRFF